MAYPLAFVAIARKRRPAITEGMKRPLRQILMVSACTALLALGACDADDEDEVDEIAAKNEEVDVLYERALATFQSRQFKKSIDEFEEVERQHPYSEWAPRAEIMAAYAGYRGGQFDDAIAIRTMAYLTLGFDHRLVDGATGDQFMADIKHQIEHFDE